MRIVTDNGDSHEGDYFGRGPDTLCVEIEDGTVVMLLMSKIAHIELEKHELEPFGVA